MTATKLHRDSAGGRHCGLLLLMLMLLSALALATGATRPLTAADEPGLDQPDRPAPVALFREDPLESSAGYLQRLLAAQAAGQTDPGVIEPLQFNLALAYTREKQFVSAEPLYDALAKTHAGEFQLLLAAFENGCEAYDPPSDLESRFNQLANLSSDELPLRLQLLDAVMRQPSAAALRRPALELAGQRLGVFITAGDGASARAWMQRIDQWLVTVGSLDALQELRLAFIQDQVPGTRDQVRYDYRRLAACMEAAEARPLLLEFWEKQLADPRADWPADATVSAALDRLRCFQEILSWTATSAAELTRAEQDFPALVLACKAADRTAAFATFQSWSKTLAAEPAPLGWQTQQLRRKVAELVLNDKDSAPETLLAAGDTLVDYVAALNRQPGVGRRPDLRTIGELSLAAVIAFDRAHKQGQPIDCRGLKALIQAIAVSNEDPDINAAKTPRYRVIYDFLPLLKDPAVSLEAATLFRDFKATRLPPWRATLWTLDEAVKAQAPAATLQALLKDAAWPEDVGEELLAGLERWAPATTADPGLQLAAAKLELQFGAWDRAAQRLHTLAAVQPTGDFVADVATATALMAVTDLQAQLSAEVDAVLATAVRVAPADSETLGRAAQTLCDLRYEQGDAAGAAAALQTWWDRAQTAEQLRTAAAARINLCLTREQDLPAARQLHADLLKRLPHDPVVRWSVLQPLLAALADTGATADFQTVIQTELAEANLSPGLAANLSLAQGDELQVQGAAPAALQAYMAALTQAAAADKLDLLHQVAAPSTELLWQRLQTLAVRFAAIQPAFEAAALKALDPVDVDPIVGRQLVAYYQKTQKAKAAADLLIRLADERPWHLALRAEAAQAAVQIGDRAAASRQNQALLKVDPVQPAALQALLLIAVQTNDSDLTTTTLAALAAHIRPADGEALQPQLLALHRDDLVTDLWDRVTARYQRLTRPAFEWQLRTQLRNSPAHAVAHTLGDYALAQARLRLDAEPTYPTAPLTPTGELSKLLTISTLTPELRTQLIAALPRALPKIEAAVGDFSYATASAELVWLTAELLRANNQPDDALQLLRPTTIEEFTTFADRYADDRPFLIGLCLQVLPGQKDPEFLTAIHRTLALTYERQGQRDKLFDSYHWLVDHAPAATQTAWRAKFADLLLSRNRWQEALQIYTDLDAAQPTAAITLHCWQIRRGHPIAGEPDAADWLKQRIEATRKPEYIAYRGELCNLLNQYKDYTDAEAIARSLLADAAPADRPAALQALFNSLRQRKLHAQVVTLLDVEATTGASVNELRPQLTAYLADLFASDQFTAPLLQASPLLKALPAEEVWAALLAQAGNDGDRMETLYAYQQAVAQPFAWAYIDSLLRADRYDEALLALTGATPGQPEFKTLKLTPYRLRVAAERLRAGLPDIALQLLDLALAAQPGDLDATQLQLHRGECLIALSRLNEAADLFAARRLDDPARPEFARLPRVPASLQETWRQAQFACLLNQLRDPAAALQLLPVRRTASSDSLRQALWDEARAGGRTRDCLNLLDAARATDHRRLAADLRWNWICDLLALSADPDHGGAVFRQQAFHLALDSFTQAELAGRRAAVADTEVNPDSTSNADRTRDEACRRWLYLLRNLVRQEDGLREDLDAALWSLAQTQPLDDTRVTRSLMVIAGDHIGNAGRLAVLDKAAGFQPLNSTLTAQRLELLRQLKRTDDLLDWARQQTAQMPNDRGALLQLAQELNTVAADSDPAAAQALQAESRAACEKIVRLCDRYDAADQINWADALQALAPDLSLQLDRRAAECDPGISSVRPYTAQLLQRGHLATALQTEIAALFVREWRAQEGRPADQPTSLFLEQFANLFPGEEAAAVALERLQAARITAVSPRHRTVLWLLCVRLEGNHGRKAAAVAAGKEALAAADLNVYDPTDTLGAWYLDWDWQAEAGALFRAAASRLPAGPDRRNYLRRALTAFDAAQQPGPAAEILERLIAEADPAADLAADRLRLAAAYHRLDRDADAAKIFQAAIDTGAPATRYSAWTAWRTTLLNMTVAADRDRVLHDFPVWVDQMDTFDGRTAVLRDYAAFLESLRRWTEAAAVNAQIAVNSEGYSRQQAILSQMRQLIASGKVDDAAEIARAELAAGTLSPVEVTAPLRTACQKFSGPEVAEFLLRHFQPLNLDWDQWQTLILNIAGDWRRQGSVRGLLVSRLLADRPADAQMLNVALPWWLDQGEYDQAFAAVARALDPASHPAAGLRNTLAHLLANRNCNAQAASLLQADRTAAPAASWRADQLDLRLAEIDLKLGHAPAAQARWESLRTHSLFAGLRRQATRRLFDYQLDWQRDAAAAEILYQAELAACPVGPQVNYMLTRLMAFRRDRAELPACGTLLEQRLAAGLLFAAERDSLTLDRAQLQIDQAAAARRDPAAETGEAILGVFRRRYLILARKLEDNANDALYTRARGMLVKLWTRSQSAAAWKRAEPTLAGLAAVERPGYHRISDLRLEVFRQREDREAVVAELRTRAAREPEDVSLHNQLIQACVEARQYTAAVDLLKQDQTARPADFRPAFALVDLYLVAGQPDQATQAFAAALQLAPTDPAELEALGKRYEERRRFDWALELYRRRQALRPDLPAADNLARLAERMERPLEAVKTYLAFYAGLFAPPTAGNRAPAVDFHLAERMTPYARNERDFDAAVALVEAARTAAPTTAHKAFLTLALADLQYLRRRHSEALKLYAEAARLRFPGRDQLLEYLLERLPARKGVDQALALGHDLLNDFAFSTDFTPAVQAQLLRRIADNAGQNHQTADQDAAWQKLIDTTDRAQQAAQIMEFGATLANRKDFAGASRQYARAVALETDLNRRRNDYDVWTLLLDSSGDATGAAETGDAAVAAELALGSAGQPERWTAANHWRWLQAGNPARAAQLLQTVAAGAALNDRQKQAIFGAVVSTAVTFDPQVNLDATFDALTAYLPPTDGWRILLLKARRLGRTDPTAAQALFDAARVQSAKAAVTPAAAEAATLELLNAEIEILVFNKRAGQAAKLWHDALNERHGKLPGGDHQLVRLYMGANRADLAAAFLLEILQTGDRDRIQAAANDLNDLGYSLATSKSQAIRDRFEPLAEAALAAGEPTAARYAATNWLRILDTDGRVPDMVAFTTRILPLFPVTEYDRTNLAGTTFSRLHSLLHDDRQKNLPHPTDAAVLDLIFTYLLPALDSNNAQISNSYIGSLLDRLKLFNPAVARLRAEVDRRIAAEHCPIALNLRAGNLVRNQFSGQTAEAIRYWEAALAGQPPIAAQLAAQLRDGYRELHQLDTALIHQTALLQLNPWDVNTRIESAALLTELHRDAEADEAWKAAVQLASASEDQLRQIADRMVGVRRFAAAIPVYTSAYDLAVRRGSISSWLRAGLVSGLVRCEWELGDHKQAFKFWNEGLARISRRDGYHENLMETLVDLLRLVPDLDALVKQHETAMGPSGADNPNLREAFGRAFQRKGDMLGEPQRFAWDDKALAQLAIAAELLPQEPRIRERMIDLYRTRHAWESMIAQYREIARNDPKNINCYEQMGELYEKLGRLDDRERAWSMILEALPRNGEGHRALARIFLEHRMSARAVAEARGVIDNRPEDPASYNLLGDMLTGDKQFAAAEKTYLGVLARAKEWQEKRYWDQLWREPADGGLLNLYQAWVSDRLVAHDEPGAADVRRRAHAHSVTLARLKQQSSPNRLGDDTDQDWNRRQAAWQYLRDQMPAKAPTSPDPESQPPGDDGLEGGPELLPAGIEE